MPVFGECEATIAELGTEAVHERLVRALAPALASGVVVLGVGALAWALGVPALTPPLGATAFLCFYRPNSPVSSPRNVICGHGLGILSALLALVACGTAGAPSALSVGLSAPQMFACALAVSLTAFTTETLRCSHPPALATTLVVSLGVLRGGRGLLAFLVGTLAVVLLAHLLKLILYRTIGSPTDTALVSSARRGSTRRSSRA